MYMQTSIWKGLDFFANGMNNNPNVLDNWILPLLKVPGKYSASQENSKLKEKQSNVHEHIDC
jgi:hypothetical protein